MTKTYYIGLDVHKETIAIAYATGGTREDSVYHGPCGGSVLSAERALRKPNEKTKTDKRDACKIARNFRNGDITHVRIPPVLDEAVRDVCRARTDASDDLSCPSSDSFPEKTPAAPNTGRAPSPNAATATAAGCLWNAPNISGRH